MFLKLKKFICIIALVSIAGVLFLPPRPAKAQWTVSAPALEAIKIQEQVKKTIGAGIVQAGTIALINALDYFVQKLAYDVGTWIGSGGPGEKPLFDTKSTGEYFKDLALDTAAGAIQEITTEVTKSLGKAMDSQYLKSFNVCAPVAPQVLLKMQLGLLINANLQPPTAKCSWNQLVTNWDNVYQQWESGELLKNFGVVFEGGQSELSAALEINAKTAARLEIAKRQAELDRAYGGKWKDNTNFLTGRVTAPSDVVKMSFGESWIKGDTAKQTASFNATMSALGAGAWQVVGSGIQTLTQAALKAAISKVIGKVFTMFDLYEPPRDGGPALVDVPGGAAVGRRQVEAVLNDLLRPTIRSSANYDPVLEFTACPAAEAEKQINNCVMDDGFANAVRVSGGKPLTLDEAIKQGYLHGDWPLIFSRDPRNEQKDCYARGYCYSNLVKLRKARILPVGFELAAELAGSGTVAIAGSGALNVNLKTVMDNFYNCGEDANKNPIRDSGHPFCHLIDPNWVLKVPKTQCQAQVYGPTLISGEGSIRAEVCADPITCISEDDSGNCTGGWGYCTKEKNIWRIDGDKCPEQFNSCTTYKTRAGGVENYLKNTVDFGLCSEANTGCRPYAKEQAGGIWNLASDKRAYFNKNLEACAAKDAGCSEVYDTSDGLKYNLLPNPSFEKFSGSANLATFSGWTNGHDTASGFDAFDGKTAAKVFVSEMETEQAVKLELNTPYTFSVYARGGAGGQYTAVLGARLFADFAAQQPFSAANIITTCKNTEGNVLGVSAAAPNDSFARLSCSFLSPNQTLYAKIALSTVGGDVVWYDAAQLEAGAEATPFLASGYGAVNSKFIKIPPAYLNCEAGSTDPACANYSATCRADEAGCAKYSPTSGDPAITGIVAANDTCTASCAGYETYKQEATVYDPQPSPQFSYFIPQTAQVCNATDVGCDEFTNLENEARDYFTLLRQCIKPDSKLEATYYTWEGSDQTGYELKSHKLKKDSVSGGPEYVAGVSAALCDQAIFKAKLGDPNYNPDCREFYDSQGKIYYRLLSKTIVSTPECATYRKTDSNQVNCAATGGQWDSAKSICVYQGYKSGSLSCNAGGNGCRAWSGAAASNLRFVFQDDFESGGIGQWQSGTVSSESLSAGGHSLKFSGVTLERELATSSPVFANKTYIVSFWAKAPSGGKLTVNFTGAAAQTAKAGANIVDLKGEWRYFEVGPFNLTSVAANPRLQLALSGGAGFYLDNAVLKEVRERLFLVKNSWKTPLECDQTNAGVFLPQAQLGCKAYKDRDGKNEYLKSFSSLCRDVAAGCALFRNTQNSASDKSEIYNAICALNHFVQDDFEECPVAGRTVCNVGRGSVFCRFKIDDAAGLAPTFMPQSGKKLSAYQTDLMSKVGSAVSATFSDESTVAVPADANIYLVDDGKHYCQNKDLGCREMGQMSLYKSAAGTVSTVYFKDKPNDYSSLLCGAESEGCESWTGDKGTDFFKVPSNLCEYKEGGTITAAGWYKKGTAEACYATKDIKGNITSVYIKDGGFGIWRNADAAYDGSAGICGTVFNSCAEFIDPQDTSSANKSGKPYYLLDNEKLKAIANDPACSAKASLEEGCVLFNKTSDIVKMWNAGATYLKSSREKTLAAPQTKGYCEWRRKTGASIIGKAMYDSGADSGRACLTDTDCPAAGKVFGDPLQIAGGGAEYTGACKEFSDANIILKVTRDRECGEWLTCKTSFSATDPITKKTKPICAEVGLCDKYQATAGSSSLCANFIPRNPDIGVLLTADNYSGRQVGWAGREYSGFSIGGQYPVTDARFKKIDDEGRIGMFAWSSEINPLTGKLTDRDLKGNILEFKIQAEPSTCRGYPEQDSPFPASAGQYDTQGFKNANICDSAVKGCECDYTKLVYGTTAVKKYTGYGNRLIPKGICQGGQNDGGSCDPAATFENDPKNSCGDPGQGGTCLKLKRYDDVIGWSGYCLERDLSTTINGNKDQKACLTWLPQDLVQGGRDIYNQFRLAGYVPPIGGGKYYCLQAGGHWNGITDSYDYPLIMSASSKECEVAKRNQDGSVKWTYTSKKEEVDACNRQLVTSGTNFITKDPLGLIESYTEYKKSDGTGIISLEGAPIYKHEIDVVRIKFGSTNNPTSYPTGGVFYIRPEQKNTNYTPGKACSGNTINNCSGEEEGGAFLSGSKRARSIIEGNKWYFRYDDGEFGDQDFLNADLHDNYTCPQSADWNRTGIQIKLVFDDTTGKLSGVAYSGCDQKTGNTQNTILFVSIRKREICEKVVDLAAFKNQAFTNNLWLDNPDNKEEKLITFNDTGTNLKIPYHYNYEMRPFGGASSNLAPSRDIWYSYYTSGKKNFAGVPWACPGAYSVKAVDGAVPVGGLGCGTPERSDKDETTIDFDRTKKFLDPNYAPDNISLERAKKYLGNLFNKIFNVFNLVDKNIINNAPDAYSSVNCEKDPNNTDCYLASPREEKVKYPRIFAFDINKPLNNNNNKQYELSTINRVLVNNNLSDISIRGNQYLASVKFYAWADTNHMPLKSIKIDWGDGTVTETLDGMYKNHKPICAKSNTDSVDVCSKDENIVCSNASACPAYYRIIPPSSTCVINCEFAPPSERNYAYAPVTQTCSAKAQTFGNSPDACEENYFEFQHNYVCNDISCTYQPKVIVTDNWGVKNSFECLDYSGKVTACVSGQSATELFGPALGPKITLQP